MVPVKEKPVDTDTREPRTTYVYPIQIRHDENPSLARDLYELPIQPDQAKAYVGHVLNALEEAFESIPGKVIPTQGSTPDIFEIPPLGQAFTYFRGLNWETVGMEFPPSGFVTVTLIGKENGETSRFTRAEISLNENRQLASVGVHTLDGNRETGGPGLIYNPNNKVPGTDLYDKPQLQQYLGYWGQTSSGQSYLVQKTI